MKKQITQIKFGVFSIGFLSSCAQGLSGSGLDSVLTVNTIGTSATATSLTQVAPSGTGYGTVVVDQGSDFLPANMCSGKTIFGRAGGASCASSGAYHNVGTLQLSLAAEANIYGGGSSSTVLPTTGGYSYRDVPDVTKDDDGYYNSDAGCTTSCTPVVSVSKSTHQNFLTCGETQTTIADRIADCASRNGSSATWDGTQNGNAGQAVWKLVTVKTPVNGSGSCGSYPYTGTPGSVCYYKEVWQDQRTGLVWSSRVAIPTDYWCKAAGNAQAIDVSGVGPCNNTTYQPSYNATASLNAAQSYCSETGDTTMQPVPATGESWTAGSYSAAKGGMGLNSTPSIRWRLPTIYDFLQANIDGIRYVMPDMNVFTNSTGDWSATIESSATRNQAWQFRSQSFGTGVTISRLGLSNVRCVGR